MTNASVRARTRLSLVVAAAILASCVGPQGGHREGKEWPTEVTPHFTNLYGRVTAAGNVPLAGAKVDVGTASAITNADGRYTFASLPLQMAQVVTSLEGFDTVRTQLALPKGDLQWNIRLNPAPVAAH